MGRPLAFALISHWIGTAFAYLWAILAGRGIESMASHFQFSGQGTNIDSAARMTQWFHMQQQAAHFFWSWFWGAGSIILDPFKTLLAIFVTSALVYFAARLFVTSERQNQVTYESAVRIVSYGMMPAIVAVFPFIGGFVAAIYASVVTIIGAREAYRTSNGRAILIVLFPELLILGIIAVGVLLMALVAMKFAVTFF